METFAKRTDTNVFLNIYDTPYALSICWVNILTYCMWWASALGGRWLIRSKVATFTNYFSKEVDPKVPKFCTSFINSLKYLSWSMCLFFSSYVSLCFCLLYVVVFVFGCCLVLCMWGVDSCRATQTQFVRLANFWWLWQEKAKKDQKGDFVPQKTTRYIEMHLNNAHIHT